MVPGSYGIRECLHVRSFPPDTNKIWPTEENAQKSQTVRTALAQKHSKARFKDATRGRIHKQCERQKWEDGRGKVNNTVTPQTVDPLRAETMRAIERQTVRTSADIRQNRARKLYYTHLNTGLTSTLQSYNRAETAESPTTSYAHRQSCVCEVRELCIVGITLWRTL